MPTRQSKQANKKHSRKVKGFSPELRRWLVGYSWKGNVRQLKNIVESLVVMDVDDLLDMDDLSPELLAEQPQLAAVKSSNGSENVPSDSSAMDAVSSSLIGKSLKEIERWTIEHTLTLANHNREETANILGISERNLYRKLKEYDLR